MPLVCQDLFCDSKTCSPLRLVRVIEALLGFGFWRLEFAVYLAMTRTSADSYFTLRVFQWISRSSEDVDAYGSGSGSYWLFTCGRQMAYLGV